MPHEVFLPQEETAGCSAGLSPKLSCKTAVVEFILKLKATNQTHSLKSVVHTGISLTETAPWPFIAPT